MSDRITSFQNHSQSSFSRNGSGYSSQNQTETDTDRSFSSSLEGRANRTVQIPSVQDHALILFHPPYFGEKIKDGEVTRTRLQRRRHVREQRHNDQKVLQKLYCTNYENVHEHDHLLGRISSRQNVKNIFQIAESRKNVEQEHYKKSRLKKRPRTHIAKVRGSAWKLRFGTDGDRFFQSPSSPRRNRNQSRGVRRSSRAQKQWQRLRLAHQAGVAFRAGARKAGRKSGRGQGDGMLSVHMEEGDATHDKGGSAGSSPRRRRPRRSSLTKGVDFIHSIIQRRTMRASENAGQAGTLVEAGHVPGRSSVGGSRWMKLRSLFTGGRVKPLVEEKPKNERQLGSRELAAAQDSVAGELIGEEAAATASSGNPKETESREAGPPTNDKSKSSDDDTASGAVGKKEPAANGVSVIKTTAEKVVSVFGGGRAVSGAQDSTPRPAGLVRSTTLSSLGVSRQDDESIHKRSSVSFKSLNPALIIGNGGSANGEIFFNLSKELSLATKVTESKRIKLERFQREVLRSKLGKGDSSGSVL